MQGPQQISEQIIASSSKAATTFAELRQLLLRQ